MMGYAGSGAGGSASDCTQPLVMWCILALTCAFLHVAFACYYYFLFVKMGEDAAAAGAGGMQGVDMQSEARNIFCYDPWTAIYLLIYIFSFAWGFVGNSYVDKEGGVECSVSRTKEAVDTVSTFLIVFGAVTPVVIWIGLWYVRISSDSSCV
jgi:hypothetical protein